MVDQASGGKPPSPSANYMGNTEGHAHAVFYLVEWHHLYCSRVLPLNVLGLYSQPFCLGQMSPAKALQSKFSTLEFYTWLWTDVLGMLEMHIFNT